MPNLLQGVKIEWKIEFPMEPQENTTISNIKKTMDLYKNSKKLLDTVPKEFTDAINTKLRLDVGNVRSNKWQQYRSLPDKLIKMYNYSGEYSDILTALNALPKVKISEFRRLADNFNMVIIPVEYTELEKALEVQTDSYQLKKGLKYFNELLRQDTTTNYQSYILCPIDYYNVWEQIKSDKSLPIYYPEYFETIFSTLELLIPAQKNLYLASKTNDENLKALSSSFDTNIKTLNDKITSISNKVNKLEIEFIEQKRKTELEIENLQKQNKKLQKTVLEQQRQVEFSYSMLDPILFAVPSETNIVEDDTISIVGLCWGEDIDEMIFDMKGITIENKDLTKINPLNIKEKIEKENFQLEYGKIVDASELVLNVIKNNLTKLNKLRYKKNWSDNNYRFHLPLDGGFKIWFRYDYDYSNMHIYNIQVTDKTDNYICNIDISHYRVDSLDEDDSNDKFFKVYEKYFNSIATSFKNYCKKK